jgi:N4-gp56 family major capsid protein
MGNELSTELDAIQDYFTDKALEEREYDSPLLKLAQKPVIPKGKKDVAHFFRWSKLGYAEDVTEGADPATDETMDQTEIKVELTEISKAMKVIYYADAQRILKVAEETYPKFREQVERSVNRKLTTALNAGSSSGNNSFSKATQMYANGKTAFAQLGVDDYLRETDIQRAVSKLIKNGFKGPYHCVLNPWSRQSLFEYDASFRDFIKQAGGKEMRTGTIGEWGGATIHLMHEPFRETRGGAEETRDDSGDVVSNYIFAEGDAYGVSTFGGKSGLMPEFFINPYLTKTKAYFYIGYRVPVAGVTLDPNKIIQMKSVINEA